MITLIEALNYRSLRRVRQEMQPFHVLVGPNASGKTAFLDVISFLGQFVSEGLEAAVGERTQDFRDLVFGRSGTRFELAIEARIPADFRGRLAPWDTIRYEVGLALQADTGEVSIRSERALLKVRRQIRILQPRLFPAPLEPVDTIAERAERGMRTVLRKVPGGNDNFYSETYKETGKGWAPAFKLGPRKSALGNLPEDETKFPASTWLKRLLIEGVQQFILNSLLVRRASPPGQGRALRSDGSNLPWVIENLRTKAPERFRDWVKHLRTALPDIEEIRTVERSDDRHRYLMIRYQNGVELPSWVVSDGTLRLLALTLPAYLPEFRGIYLIEEPENGIHPRAVETMFQSLSSVYDAQLLLATHSPIILGIAEVQSVLCFARTEGATAIVSGDKHPVLAEWRGETDLGVLFAAGVLG
jgi:predicted ATPase